MDIICTNLTICSSRIDMSAAENIGRVIAQRCRESGITRMALQPPEEANSEKVISRGIVVVASYHSIAFIKAQYNVPFYMDIQEVII